jgi:Homeodomain-like domain
MNAVPNLRRIPPRLRRVLSIPIDPFAETSPLAMFKQIARSIGDDATDKLIEDFGGRRLYVPRAPGPGDQLTASIGLAAALGLARTFGGDRLMIPLSGSNERRRIRILAMRSDNISVSRIARSLRCTERYVYKVLALERLAATPALAAEHFNRGSIARS